MAGCVEGEKYRKPCFFLTIRSSFFKNNFSLVPTGNWILDTLNLSLVYIGLNIIQWTSIFGATGQVVLIPKTQSICWDLGNFVRPLLSWRFWGMRPGKFWRSHAPKTRGFTMVYLLTYWADLCKDRWVLKHGYLYFSMWYGRIEPRFECFSEGFLNGEFIVSRFTCTCHLCM